VGACSLPAPWPVDWRCAAAPPSRTDRTGGLTTDVR
jgi:hypothetical protein